MGALGLSLPGLIPVGTTVVFTVGVETGALSGITDIEQGLNGEMANAGLPVTGGWKSAGGLAQIGIPFTTATLTGTIYTTGTFSDLGTMSAIIDGAVEDVTGSPPVSSTSITSVTLPGQAAQATGQPQTQAPGTPGIVDSIESFLSTLGTDTITALVVVVAVIIVILLIVGYAPNVKHVAAAVA